MSAILPAATLSVQVAIKGVTKGNAELLKFHGNLKQVSGESATATLKAKLDNTGFDAFKAKMTEAKLEAARPIVQEARLKYDKGAFSDLRREAFLTRKAMSGIGGDSGFGSALKGAVLPFGKIGTAALAASPSVVSLAGGITAVTGSLAGATEGAGALTIALGGMATVGIGGIAAVAVPAVLSLKALTEAQKSYIAAVETYGVQSSQAETAAKKLQAAERGAGPEAVKLVKSLDQVKERWASITKPGREAFLGGLSDVIDRVDKKLPLLGASANRSAKVGREGFDEFLGAVTGSDFDRFVKTMTRTEETVVPQLSKATGDWGRILERVATDAAPSLERVVGTFSHWSKEVLGSTANSQKLSGEIDHLTGDFMDWVHLLDASGSLLHDIFKAGEGSGNSLVVDLTKQMREWDQWIETHGPEVQGFFTESEDGVKALASILAHTGKDWFVMSQAMEPVETLLLHILDDFAQIHIGGQSALTYLLGAFALLKVAIAAVKIKDLIEFMGFLRGSAASSTGEVDALVAALQAQTDAAMAASAANSDLAASNEAVGASAQMTMLEMGPLADAEKAGQLSMFPMGGGVMPREVEGAGSEIEGAGVGASAGLGAGSITSRLAAALSPTGADGAALLGGLGVLGGVAGGYFLTEFLSEVTNLGTEGQSVMKSLVHGFNNTKDVAKTEARALADAFSGELKRSLAHGGSARELWTASHNRSRAISPEQTEGIRGESEVLGRLKSGYVQELPQIKKLLQRGAMEAAKAFGEGSPEFRAAAADNMHAAIASIKAGEQAGYITVKQGNAEIASLLHNARLVTGSDPFGIARSFVRTWEETGGVNHRGIAKTMGELGQMPPRMRAIAIQMELAQVKAAEKAGTLTKGSYARLRSAVVADFGLMALKGGKNAEILSTKVVGAFGEMNAFVAEALKAIGGNTESVLKALSGASLPSFHLKKTLKPSGAIKGYQKSYAESQNRQQGGFIVPGTGSGDRPGFTGEPGAFVLNREATRAYGFNSGGAVPLALEPGERYFSRAEAQRIGPHNLAAMNASVPRQKGGAIGPEPQITGPSGSLRSIGQDAVHQVYKGAEAYIAAHRPAGGGSISLSGGLVASPLRFAEYMLQAGFPRNVGVISEGLGTILSESGFKVNNGQGPGGHIGPWAESPAFGSVKVREDPLGSTEAAYREWVRDGHSFWQAWGQWEAAQSGLAGGGAGSYASQFRAVAEEALGAHSAAKALHRAKGGPVGSGPDRDASKAELSRLQQHLITGGEALGVPTHIEPSSSTSTKTKGPSALERILGEMKSLNGTPYALGGGHAGFVSHPANLDCSGAVSYALHAGVPSLISSPLTSGALEGFGQPGGGKVTVFANSGHAFMDVLGRYWGTSVDDNGQGGLGFHPAPSSGYLAGFVKRHVPEAMLGKAPEGFSGSSFKEKVPGQFKGAQTAKLSLGTSTPKTLHGVQKEIARWEGKLRIYRRAAAAARNAPATQHAIQVNIAVIERRLSVLRKAASKLRQQIAKKHFSGHLGKALGKVTGFEKQIELRQREYTQREEFAQQVVGLEPTEPILAANATEAQREASEKAYVSNLSSYIEGTERPAYLSVLESEANWRNTILAGESAATGFNTNQEFRIRLLGRQIAAINALTAKTASEAKDWRKAHPGQNYPVGLKARIETAADERATLPMLRFEEAERRKALGEGRAEFYGGRKHPVQPPIAPIAGSGSLEEHLIEVQGSHWPKLHSPLFPLPQTRSAGSFGGAIWQTQEAMEGLGLTIQQANAAITGAGGAEANTEREELLEGQLREANQRLAINAALEPTLNQFVSSYPLPYMGAFAAGGVALVGEEGPELAHFPSGTRIHSAGDTEQMIGRPETHVVINGDIHQKPGDTRDPVEIWMRDPRNQKMVRQIVADTPRPIGGGSGTTHAWRP